jgi:hypothetical protein
MESLSVLVREAAIPIGNAPMPPAGWLSRLGILLPSLAASLAGLVSEEAATGWVLLHPLVLGYAVPAMIGMVLLLCRGEMLPPLVSLSVVLTLPVLTGYLGPVVEKSRYFGSLLPLGYIAVAATICALASAASLAVRGVSLTRSLRLGIVAVMVVILTAGPLALLNDYYRRAERAGLTNQAVFQALAALDRSRGPREIVYVDRALRAVDTANGGSLFNPLRLVLEARQYPYRQVTVDRDSLPTGRGADASRLMILWGGSYPEADRLYRLEPLPGEPGSLSPIRVVRATR